MPGRGKQKAPLLPPRIAFQFHLRADGEELAFIEGRKKALGIESDTGYFRYLLEQDYNNEKLKALKSCM